MGKLATVARRAACIVLQSPVPNPIAALAPTMAVTATAVAVLPLIAAEQFSGARRPSEPESDADGDDRERPESVEADPVDGTAVDAQTDVSGEPIAIDSRRENRRNGTKREKNREERSERRSEQRAAREERPRRRRGDEQPDLQAVGVAATAERDGPEDPAPRPAAAEVATGLLAVGADSEAPSADPPEQAVEPALTAEPQPVPEQQAVPAETEQPATLQRVVTEQGVLAAPLVDTAVQSPRSVERLRVQKEQAEKAILSSPDVTAAVAPLIRHVNAITLQLNEAQLTIGKLTAERDALRQRLIDETGSFAEQIDRQVESDVREIERRQQRQLRLEAREDERNADGDAVDEPGRVKRYFQQAGFIIPEDAGEEEFKQAARKRQIIAVVVFASIALGMWIAQRSGNDVGTISRESLAEIAFLGFFVQIFLALWILYRIVRVGGKGARWLFPQQNTRRRRR